MSYVLAVSVHTSHVGFHQAVFHHKMRAPDINSRIPNGVEHIITIFAANKIDCPCIPMNPKNLINMDETAHMAQVCQENGGVDKVVFVTHDAGMMEQIEALSSVGAAVKILVKYPAIDRGWVGFEEVMKDAQRADGDAYPKRL